MTRGAWAATLAGARALAAELAPGKPVIETSQSEVPAEIVLGIRSARVLAQRSNVLDDKFCASRHLC